MKLINMHGRRKKEAMNVIKPMKNLRTVFDAWKVNTNMAIGDLNDKVRARTHSMIMISAVMKKFYQFSQRSAFWEIKTFSDQTLDQ